MLEDKWVVDVDLPPNLLIHRVDERLQKLVRFNFFYKYKFKPHTFIHYVKDGLINYPSISVSVHYMD